MLKKSLNILTFSSKSHKGIKWLRVFKGMYIPFEKDGYPHSPIFGKSYIFLFIYKQIISPIPPTLEPNEIKLKNSNFFLYHTCHLKNLYHTFIEISMIYNFYSVFIIYLEEELKKERYDIVLTNHMTFSKK